MTVLRELNPDFRDLLLAFTAEDVEFVIVGAYALALHGVPRFTGDLDVFIRPSAQNASRVWRRRRRPLEAVTAPTRRAETTSGTPPGGDAPLCDARDAVAES